MRKYLLVIALTILSAGLGAGQVKADSVCAAGTLATYASSGFSCNIGGILDFSGFSSMGVFPAGPGTTPFGASQVLLTPVSGVSGTGFIISFPAGDQATPTGVRDIELPFEVKCVGGSACLSSIFMSMTGTATVGATDILTETYCVGGVAPPPTAPCPAIQGGGPTTQDILTINSSNSGGTVSRTDTFAGVNQLSMNKDIQATGNTGVATITQVQDLFNPSSISTPEPSTIILLAIGLLTLAFVVRRKQLTF